MESQFLGFHGLTLQFELQTLGIGAGENDFVGIADGIPFANDNVSECVNLCGVHGSGSFQSVARAASASEISPARWSASTKSTKAQRVSVG